MEEESKNDYFNAFIRTAITDFENKGVCYVFSKEHVEEVLKIFPEAEVLESECGYVIMEG